MAEFDFKATSGVFIPKELQKVLEQQLAPRVKRDAPSPRLTANTFPSTMGIADWVQSGELVKAVNNFNRGGLYDTTTGTCWPKDFWLMRIFDAMEEVGKAHFDKYVPGVWDSILEIYFNTFTAKIATVKSVDALYGA